MYSIENDVRSNNIRYSREISTIDAAENQREVIDGRGIPELEEGRSACKLSTFKDRVRIGWKDIRNDKGRFPKTTSLAIIEEGTI